MIQHTPGPWVVAPKTEYGVFNPSIITPEGGSICTVYGDNGEPVLANANLIAAAPDLLAALKNALADSGCDGDLCMHYWHEQARAAIAKAEDAATR